MIYFDNAATTVPYNEVIEEVSSVMKNYFGNPSSAHKLGLIAERKLNEYREILAKTINATKEEIIFTSGGSESNSFLIRGFLKEKGHIITSNIEHPSILHLCKELELEGYRVTYLKVNNEGIIDLEEFKEALSKDTILVTLMYINNEIGSIQPIKEVGNILKDYSKVKFHVDAIQAYGKIKIDVKECNIDLMSCSGHKIHGPKGIGMAYMKKGLNPKPLIVGGAQEMGKRAGTENLASIGGFAKAGNMINLNIKDNYEKVLKIKESFIDGLKDIEGVKINSKISEFNSPYILNVSFKGLRGEVFLHMLEEKEIYVSTGSACSSKDKKYSHVLKAIELSNEEIEGAIRFSFNEFNTENEVNETLEIIKASLKFLRRVKR